MTEIQSLKSIDASEVPTRVRDNLIRIHDFRIPLNSYSPTRRNLPAHENQLKTRINRDNLDIVSGLRRGQQFAFSTQMVGHKYWTLMAVGQRQTKLTKKIMDKSKLVD